MYILNICCSALSALRVQIAVLINYSDGNKGK